jgi:hypothetical protein
MARKIPIRPEREILPMQKASGELDGLPVRAQNCGTVCAAIDVGSKRHSSRSANARR